MTTWMVHSSKIGLPLKSHTSNNASLKSDYTKSDVVCVQVCTHVMCGLMQLSTNVNVMPSHVSSDHVSSLPATSLMTTQLHIHHSLLLFLHSTPIPPTEPPHPTPHILWPHLVTNSNVHWQWHSPLVLFLLALCCTRPIPPMPASCHMISHKVQGTTMTYGLDATLCSFYTKWGPNQIAKAQKEQTECHDAIFQSRPIVHIATC